MPPLDQLTCELFSPLVGQVFQCGGVELILKSATRLGHQREGATREPFSLLFGGPRGLRAEQGIYRLSNPATGELEIFITQLSDGLQGSEFEAIFT